MIMKSFKRRQTTILWILSLIIIILLNQLFKSENLKPEIIMLTDCTPPTNNQVAFKEDIVPNIVHFIHFDKPEFTFNEIVCIKAAYKNQKPDHIIIHTNVNNFSGKYWDMVKNIPILKVIFKKKPTHIFGKELRHVFHASDVARIEVLLENGGIYLDGDMYVIQSLNKFRKFEMSFGRVDNVVSGEYLSAMGNMLLIANKGSRFLKLWYESYRAYDPGKWYYNAGELPFKIYTMCPHLAHMEMDKFGTHALFIELYTMYWSKWKDYYSIHLLSRYKALSFFKDFILKFDENSIKKFDKTYGEMARLVLYNTSDII